MRNSPLEVPPDEELSTTDDGEEDTPDPSSILDSPYYTQDSPLLASEAEHAASDRKSRRGRPPKPIPTEEEAREALKTGLLGAKPLPVPTPPHRLYKSDATSPARLTKQFYNWWNALPTWAKNYSTAYIYREHPILVDPVEGEFKYIEKIDGNQPLQDDIDLLNRYGCGSYKIIFNELGKTEKGNNNRVLCEVFIQNLGGADYKSNPPSDKRVTDLKNLDVKHPGNTSYMAYLRSRGIIPEEIDKKREAEEMATIQAAQSVAEQQGRTIETLTSKVVEMAERSQLTPPTPSVRMDDVRQEIQTSNRLLLADIRQMMTPTAPPVPPQDPMALALQLVTMLQTAGGTNNRELAELRAQVAQQSQQQMQVLADQVKTLLESKTTGANSGSPFSGVTDGMKAMKELKETLEDLGVPMGNQGSGVQEAAELVGVPKWLTVLAPVAERLIGTVGQVLMSRNGPVQGQPVAGNPAGMGQASVTTYSPAPVSNLPAPIPPPSLTPDFPPQLAKLLDAISYPLHNYLQDSDNPEANGKNFANFFMSGWGDETFMEIKGFGVDGIVQALGNYPPTAQMLSAIPMERLTKFVGEFVSVGLDDEEEGDEGGETATPVTKPPTLPSAS